MCDSFDGRQDQSRSGRDPTTFGRNQKRDTRANQTVTLPAHLPRTCRLRNEHVITDTEFQLLTNPLYDPFE